MRKKPEILLSILLLSLMLCGCKSKEERFELTGYVGRSVKNFEKGTVTELSEESNSVYAKKDVFQVMAVDGRINSITVLKDAKDYTIYGIKLGMNQSEAKAKLEKKFGDPISEIIDDNGNSTTTCYVNEAIDLYISFDTSKKNVSGMSYYSMNIDENNKAGKNSNAGVLIAIIGSDRVYYNEAMVYLKSAQEKYEVEYGNDIWNVDILGNGSNFGSLMKDEVMKQITELKIICDKAKELGISLEEDEIADAKSYAREHYNGLKSKDIDKYLVTQKLLEKVYEDNILADKVFVNQTINVDNKVSDSLAKQITVQHIFISSVNYDAEGNKVSLTAEEKEKAYNKAKELLKQAKDTDDFYALAEENSQSDVIEYTFGRGEGPKEYGTAFENAAFTLKTGQVSNIITTENGWHILYCKSDFNKEATTRVKEKIIEERRDKMFIKLYTQWSAEYDTIVNSAAWDNIPFEN
jgi:foldase protein PrsA